MKRWIVVAVALIMVLGLYACSENAATTHNDQNLDKQPTNQTTGNQNEPTSGKCDHAYVFGVCVYCGQVEPGKDEPGTTECDHAYVFGVCIHCGMEDIGYIQPTEPQPTEPLECAHEFVDAVCTKCGKVNYSTDLKYELNADGTGYFVTGRAYPSETEAVIPETYNGLPVVGIGYRAFAYGQCALAIIPNTVTTISEQAFYYSKLTSITIPESVTYIGKSAFDSGLKEVHINSMATWCGITFFWNGYVNTCGNPLAYGADLYLNGELVTECVIPEGVVSIGSCAFYNYKKLTSISIPAGVTNIGSYAFAGCAGLTNISIPNSLTEIGDAALENCNNLSYKRYDTAYYLGNEDNPHLIMVKAINKDISGCNIHKNTKIICGDAFYNCYRLESISVPDTVTHISGGIFRNIYSISSVYISSIEAWCNMVFESQYDNPLWYGADLYLNDELVTDLTIPETVTSIGDYVFMGCRSLVNVWVSGNVKTIGNAAFSDCENLEYVGLYDGVSNVGSKAFYDCKKLNKIYISSSVSSIGAYAFDGSWIGSRSTYLSVLIDSLEAWCRINFEKASSNPTYEYGGLYLKGEDETYHRFDELVIPESVTEIKDFTFYGCDHITSIVFSPGITSIGAYAFGDCDYLTSVTVPEGVVSIGEGVFYSCKRLRNVTLPNSLTSIGANAFDESYELDMITYTGTMEQWFEIVCGENWKPNNAKKIVCSDGTANL